MPRINNQTKNHVPAANTAAVVIFPATVDRRWRLDDITASYSAAPTGGRLTVVSDQALMPDGSDPAAKTVIDVDITASGLLPFDVPNDGIQMPDGNATMTVTLQPAGAAVVGKLNVTAHPE